MLEKFCVTIWIRKSILFSALLLQLVCFQTVTPEHMQLGKVIVDMTKQLNEVISGNISKSYFSRILDSNPVFGMNNLSTSDIEILYNSDCNILEPEQCSQQFQSVAELCNETIPRHLTIFLTVDVPTIIELNKRRNTIKIQLNKLPINLVFNLHEETKCEDFDETTYDDWNNFFGTNSSWISLHPTTKVGYGYSEVTMSCNENYIFGEVVNSADFLVLTMKFGNTVGVTESFGLFQKRMDSLHQKNVKFIKRYESSFYYGTVKKTPKSIYYPTSSSVGGEAHRRLLLKYAQSWVTSSEVDDQSIIVQAPYFEPEIINEFSVITFLNNAVNWYVPSSLAAISKYIKSVFIRHDCNILEPEQCSQQIKSVASLFNKTFPGLLTIFLTVDVPTIIEYNKRRNTTKIELPKRHINVVLNLHEETKCEDWDKTEYSDWNKLSLFHMWRVLLPNANAGFGYSEGIISCIQDFMEIPIREADFFVLTMKFGNTVGVTESFGLFKKRMDSLHKKNVKFIKRSESSSYRTVRKTPKSIYYPTSSSVGGEAHRRLLLKYAQSWVTSSEVDDQSIIVQAVYFEPEVITEFSVIPYVLDYNVKWYVPSSLVAISKYFKSVLISHGLLSVKRVVPALKLQHTSVPTFENIKERSLSGAPSRGFVRSDDLHNHIRIHIREKPYQCDVCSKEFTMSKNLGVHYRTACHQKMLNVGGRVSHDANPNGRQASPKKKKPILPPVPRVNLDTVIAEKEASTKPKRRLIQDCARFVVKLTHQNHHAK
ncbi:unnamed protein product [Orchesella dallaii]|uniref:C2H2-type domain-containing protein n=1 Tax=Orchesella dallaii TaxID=48710 RepID=A0ABP1RAG9_9HEXA